MTSVIVWIVPVGANQQQGYLHCIKARLHGTFAWHPLAPMMDANALYICIEVHRKMQMVSFGVNWP